MVEVRRVDEAGMNIHRIPILLVRLIPRLTGLAGVLIAVLLAGSALGADTPAAPPSAPGHIVVLMIWDGMRPDFVTKRDTPNLYDLGRLGTRFDHHHSMYPTLTMVNAAAIATGAAPGVNGIVANTMFLEPVLADRASALNGTPLAAKLTQPLMFENTALLASLNDSTAFAGRLLELDTVAQQLAREGGYVAIAGKAGPTFLSDDRIEALKDGVDAFGNPHKDFLFATDDLSEPPAQPGEEAAPAVNMEGVADSALDTYFTRTVTDRAIPAAKLASDAGHPSLIMLWQHNPDLTQHLAGLGTMPALEALATVDLNLGKVRAAIDAAGLTDRTDVIVASDHGFATVRMNIDLNALLVGAGLKKSLEGDDVVVARNGGSDLIYLSKTAFPTVDARREELQKIVNFAEAQEWCGPIFSRDFAPPPPAGKHRRKRPADAPYLGWIDGTFAQQVVGIFNPARSPDLTISFREISDQDNAKLTGPDQPAFALSAKGQTSVKNNSRPLVHPVKGIVYADNGKAFTTGMGMHGAAGAAELHNVCAAIGPDFKRSFVDANPTANVDIGPTITQILHLAPNVGPGGARPTGRIMSEAMPGGRSWVGTAKPIALSTTLTLQGVEVINTLRITRLGDHDYLDNATEARNPLGSSP
jgi:predicted AlkP superfamily pyrophosphatase or phosphodiesterase